MIRLVHISDIHIQTRSHWTGRDMVSRRVAGWANLRFLGRGSRFRDSVEILKVLVQDIESRYPDLLIFSGDATALGFEEEFDLAASLLGASKAGGMPILAVPGNHDYYTRRSADSGLFEKYFQRGLEGERINAATYPFARRVGPLHLIGLNSCTGNSWFWDASGAVGGEQLDRLRRLVAQPQIAAVPRILVTHYPVGTCNGSDIGRWRHLRDLQPTLDSVQAGGISLWLHGHCHHPYYLPTTPQAPVPSICVGSGTQRDLWTYAEYSFDGERWQVERRKYHPKTRRFETAERFELGLGCAQ